MNRPVALLVLAVIASSAQRAVAQEPAPPPPADPSPAQATPAEGGAHAEKEKEEEDADEGETRGYLLGLDAVLGFGGVPAVNHPPSGSPTGENTKVFSNSYVFSAGGWIARTLRLGVRIPLVHGALMPDGRPTRGAFALGNVEVLGHVAVPLARRTTLLPGVALAMPTATGEETPPNEELALEHEDGPARGRAYDRFSVLQGAAAARGFRDNALFASKRFGIIPELELEMERHPFDGGLFVKVENLLSTTGVKPTYLGEIVLGGDVRYALVRQLDVGLRAWMNYAFQEENRDGHVITVAEPQVRAHLDPVTPVVGVLLPFVPTSTKLRDEKGDPIFDPRFVSVRVGLDIAL